MSTKSLGKTKIASHGRPLGQATKKGQGSMREQLRAMQRHNRRYSGYTNHKGVEVKPRDERIKRNHMQTVSAEIRMHNAVIQRGHDRVLDDSFVPVERYFI